MKRTKPSNPQLNQPSSSSPVTPSSPSKKNGKPYNNNHKNGNGNGNGLTVKQENFVYEYLVDLNATQAAIRAGYSENSAGVVGHQNLKLPKIQEALDRAMGERAERTNVTQDKVVIELARLAFSNIKTFAKWGSGGVTILNSELLSEDDSAAVAEVSQTETQYGKSIKVKPYDKKAALELLGKHLGMFSETIVSKHIGESGGPVEHRHQFEFGDDKIKEAFDKLYGGEEFKK